MKLYVVSLLLLVTTSLFLSGCTQTESDAIVPEKNNELLVDVARPAVGSLIQELNYSGTVSGSEETVVRARVSETVLAIPVSIGQQVEKGAVLVNFDVSTGSVQYDQAKSGYDLAVKTYERYNNLLKAGAISQQMLDEIKVNLDVAEANLRSVKNLVMLESPISGTITAIHVNEGDFVTAGSAVVTVSKLSSLKTSIALSSADLQKLKVGTQVKVKLTDDPSVLSEGTIYEIAKAADPATRTFEAKIRLSSQSGFRSGQFVGVTIYISNGEKTLLLPVNSLTTKLGKQAVLVVNPDSSLSAVQITTGYRTTETVSVLSGLSPDQKVVISGTLLLKEGDKIIPREAK
ncbi:MAG: efflux RND transporter periplasmic adaptor subunit [Bacteroidetes bacterium]|nr:efflux RND transporter periplasmic adaptor subunit [Bacteroidota bacterium]